jgi:hypothetical protein
MFGLVMAGAHKVRAARICLGPARPGSKTNSLNWYIYFANKLNDHDNR